MEMDTTLSLSKEDCDFVMHYLSGQCEEHNVMDVCTAILRDYLVRQGLFTTDYPTDTARFNSLLEEHEQKKTLKEQEFIPKASTRLDTKKINCLVAIFPDTTESSN